MFLLSRRGSRHRSFGCHLVVRFRGSSCGVGDGGVGRRLSVCWTRDKSTCGHGGLVEIQVYFHSFRTSRERWSLRSRHGGLIGQRSGHDGLENVCHGHWRIDNRFLLRTTESHAAERGTLGDRCFVDKVASRIRLKSRLLGSWK